MIRAATLSACERYRYALRRTWDAARPALVFVMLNPSTADADVDDPTVRKCIGFAKRAEFGAIVVVNLYAWRATKPADLWRAPDPVGPLNDDTIREAITGQTAVLAWGAEARGDARAAAITRLAGTLARRSCVLDATADGVPRHPLMLPYAPALRPRGSL